jgi:4-amino-4-deoxy-L-arabinose transferase-like glycosyltransferase
MQNLRLSARHASGATRSAIAAIVPPWLIAAILLLLLVALNPVGYVGGGGDDWYYLEAARCAAAHGLCVPHMHWGARFPLVAPMGVALALFGITPWSVQLIPIAYALGAVILFALNVEYRFGRAVAMLASVAFVLTPAVPIHALQPQVDVPELTWTLAALLAGQVAIARRDARLAALAGGALALAVMTRMTALAFLPILGLGWLFALPADRRWLAKPFGFAFAGVLYAEGLGYWAATGNPLYGWLLSLHHTQIPTTELPSGTDLSRSALFNLDFIRGWRRSVGIHVHWTVDPLLNLLADPICGLTLIGAMALAGIRRGADADARTVRLLVIAAILHFLILTYVLAIDPKPRMFLFDFAVAATLIGVIGVRLARNGLGKGVATLIALMAALAVAKGLDRTEFRRAEAAAPEWIAAMAPQPLAIDEWTRRTLALVPSAYALPLAEPADPRPFLILARSCARTAAERGIDWHVTRILRVTEPDSAPIAWLRAHTILLEPRDATFLCLISPAQDRAAPRPA